MVMVIKRASVWISPYHLRDSKGLESSLSIWDVHEKRYSQKLYDYDPQRLILKVPRGVGQEHIRTKLDADGITIDEVIDEYGRFSAPRSISFNIHSNYRIKGQEEETHSIRDEFQEKSVDFLVYEKDAQKMLSLDVGFGKTFCAIMAVNKLKMPAMIICRTLGKQWIEFMIGSHKGYTDIHPDDVVEISGTPSILKLLQQKRKPDGIFYVASTDTLRSYMAQGGNLQELMEYLGIGIKIFDEAHLNYVANTIIDCNTNVQHTFYLTATPGRSDSQQNFLFKRIYRFVPIYGTETHTLKQYYNIRLVNYNTYPTADQVGSCSTRHGFNSKSYAGAGSL